MPPEIRSPFNHIFLLFIISLLWGSTAYAVVGDTKLVRPITSKTLPDPSQGTVIVRILNAGHIVLPFNYLTLAPKNLNESKKIKPIRLIALEEVNGKTALFASAVPAGEYSLSDIRSLHFDKSYQYDNWIDTNLEFGTFKVAPGKITDLGTVVYYTKAQGDKYVNTLVRSPTIPEGNVIKAYLPFLPYVPDETLTWNEDGYANERQTSYASVAQNPVTFNQRYQAPDGSLYFIGKLGVILKLTASKEWEVEAIDTDFDLNTMVQNKKGDTLVGGDHGTLFLKRKGGAWQNITQDHNFRIEKIIPYQEHIVDVVLRSAHEIRIIRGDLLQSALIWKKMAYYTLLSGWVDSQGKSKKVGALKLTGKKNLTKKEKARALARAARLSLINHFNIVTFDQKHAIYFNRARSGEVSRANFENKYKYKYRFDPATWKLSSYKAPRDGIKQKLNAGTIKLGIKDPYLWQLSAKDRYYRQDTNTHKWEKIATRLDGCPSVAKTKNTCKRNGKFYRRYQAFNFVSTPVFSSNLDAVAIVKFSRKSPKNKDKYNRYIFATEDGGKSWKPTKRQLPRPFCTRTVPEVLGSLMVSCLDSSDFYESFDGGKNWQQVREHEAF